MVEASPPASDFQSRFARALEAFERGDLDGAERMIGGVAAPDLGPPGGHWLATWIAAARSCLDEARELCERLIARGDLDAEARADAILLLGQILDRLGRSVEAFSAARQGKALQRRLFTARAASRESETGKLRRLAAGSAHERMAVPMIGADPAAPAGHAFLVGFPPIRHDPAGAGAWRGIPGSGQSGGAADAAPPHYAEFMTSAAGLERLARLYAGRGGAVAGGLLAEVRPRPAAPIQQGGCSWTRPRPGRSICQFAKLFPEAKVLFALRDPRDVILSCFRNTFQMNAVTYTFTDLAEAADCYGASMEMAETYRRLLPLRMAGGALRTPRGGL